VYVLDVYVYVLDVYVYVLDAHRILNESPTCMDKVTDVLHESRPTSHAAQDTRVMPHTT